MVKSEAEAVPGVALSLKHVLMIWRVALGMIIEAETRDD